MKAQREKFCDNAADETEWVSQMAINGAALQTQFLAALKAKDGVKPQSFTVSALSGRLDKITKKEREEKASRGQQSLSFTAKKSKGGDGKMEGGETEGGETGETEGGETEGGMGQDGMEVDDKN